MAMNLIASFERGSDAPYLWEFDNIPQTGRDLMLVMSQRAFGTNGSGAVLRFNSNTSITYDWQELRGTGAAVEAASYSQNSYQPAYFYNPGTATASVFGSSVLYIPNYAGNQIKNFNVEVVTENNAATAYQYLAAGTYQSTSPITKIVTTDSVATYSTVYLYLIS